jgi:hypothetical protein
MDANIIRLLKSASSLFVIMAFCVGCASLKCSSTEDVLSKLKIPAAGTRTIRYSKDYPNYSGNYEAMEVTYTNPEYLEIPMANAKCIVVMQAGKAVEAKGCNEKLIGTFSVYRNSCNFW